MTGQQIVDLASRELEYVISTQDGLDWLNHCLTEILPTIVKLENTAEFNAVKDTWYNLPADWIAAVEVRKNGDKYYGDFEVRGNRIRFPETAAFSVDYIKTIPPLSALTETPAVPEIYHRPMAFYVAGKIATVRMANPALGQAKLAEFMAICNGIAHERSYYRRDEPRRIKARAWY